VRSSNSVQFILPGGLGGVEGVFMAAGGEGASAASSQNKVLGGRIGWAGGPVGFTVAHTTSENDLTASGRFSDSTVGGTARVGPVRLNAAWRQFKQNASKQTNLLGAAVLTLGSSELKLSYLRAAFSGRVGAVDISANEASQLGLGYVYNLSKRSALYTSASRISNDGTATFVVPGGPAGIAAGNTSTGFEAGVRHIF
jgi:predicted porin